MVHVVNEIIAWAILTAQVGGFVAGLIVIVFGFVQSAGAARYSNSEGKYGFMLLLLGAVLAFLLPPFMYSINVSIKPLLITMEPALIGLFGIQPLLIMGGVGPSRPIPYRPCPRVSGRLVRRVGKKASRTEGQIMTSRIVDFQLRYHGAFVSVSQAAGLIGGYPRSPRSAARRSSPAAAPDWHHPEGGPAPFRR